MHDENNLSLLRMAVWLISTSFFFHSEGNNQIMIVLLYPFVLVKKKKLLILLREVHTLISGALFASGIGHHSHCPDIIV